MIVLAYALIALLAGEPAAEEVGGLLGDGPTTVPAAHLTEAADRLSRGYGITVQRTRAAVELLQAHGERWGSG